MKQDDGYMTSEQVCEWLQVKMDWLYDKVSKNEIPYVKIGRILRFKKTEMVTWVEEHRP